MKGTFFLGADAPCKFEVREMDFADLSPHEVMVRVMSAGICGTDIHIYHGEKGSAEVVPPVVLGHEFAGIVEAVGQEVTLVKVGDHVTLDPNMYCGNCRPCRMGKKQNCEHLFALGVNVNGGFAEYAVAPESQCYVLDKEVAFDVGAMTEPLACALHGIDRANILPGQTVLVIGGGTIGLLMIQLAKLKGASTIILSEPIGIRRQVGMQMGADTAIDPIKENLQAKIKDMIGKEEVDVVIECVGTPIAAKQALGSVGTGGTVLFFSVPPVDEKVDFPMFDIYKKELTILGSIINPDTHLRAVSLINSKRLKMEELITHRYDLYHLDEAIHKQMSSESIKVVLHPQEHKMSNISAMSGYLSVS